MVLGEFYNFDFCFFFREVVGRLSSERFLSAESTRLFSPLSVSLVFWFPTVTEANTST